MAQPAPSLLAPDRAALVVIDIQGKLAESVFEPERVRRNSVLLVRAARLLELPVVLTTQYSRGLGPMVPEVLAEAPGLEPLDKVTFGCFGSQAFCARLDELGRDRQLLVAGMESHICVAQTVLGALARGHEVHVAADAVSSRTEANWKLGLNRMERSGAVISSTEMAIYELLARSDGEAFKKLLPHLRDRV
jgi:nicotinamidase-related amidase